MFERQHIAKPLVVVELSDGTSVPGSTEIEAGAMFTSPLASARVTRCAFEPVCIRENVEPRCDPNALA